MSEINKQILQEELNRHRLLYEYSFHVEEDDVILGEVPDDEPVPDDSEETDGFEDTSDDEGFGDEGGDEGDEDGDEEETSFEDEPIDLGDDFGEEGGDDFDDFGGEDIPEEPAEDEVEVDITELVRDNEETKNIANAANQKMDLLMSKFSELQGSLTKMDGISKKIEDMEIDLDKRLPSEEEKLEMRSLDSYPYSVKLTDYWSEKDGKYDVMGNDKKNDELVLTQQDVENDYNASTIQDSFDDYEEEEFEY